MKNVLIILFAFSLLALNSQSQSYVPFPVSNAVWQEVTLPYPPGIIPYYSNHFHYFISDDTLINEFTYQKIYKTEYDVECSQHILGTNYAGAYRNDINDKKVYFLQPGTDEEVLLYDFKLNVGDTVPQTFNNYTYPDLYVYSIDSALIGNQFRKVFTYGMQTYPLIQVLEGIGAETGLIEPMEIFEYINYLRCFHQNDSLIWISSFADSCNLETDTCLSLSVQEFNANNNIIYLYPNPSEGKIKLYIENPWKYSLPLSILIFNELGNVVLQDCIIPEQEIDFDLQNRPGLYFYKIYSDSDLIKNGKILIK